MMAYKLIAVAAAYGLLWDALSRWRVRGPERRLQLQLYGYVAVLYGVVVLITGGTSIANITSASPLGVQLEQLSSQCIRGFFSAFAAAFLLLGALEIAVSTGFRDPSLPLLSRWWVRALFEGPLWRLLCQRHPGTPFTPDEAESCVRHALAGLVSIISAFWGLQVAAGIVTWNHLDPVAMVIAIRALNIWLDARLRSKQAATAPAVVSFVSG